MRIGFATTDWSQTLRDMHGQPVPGGAGWYRCVQPAIWLARHGHTVAVGVLSAKADSGEFCVRGFDGSFTDSLDVLILQRWMTEDVARDIGKARAGGQAIVNDVDDWFFGLDPANRAFQTTDPKRNPRENRDHYRAILAASTAIVTSTPHLADRLGGMLPDVPVHVVRNAIDLTKFARQQVRDEGPIRVGWVGAVPWRSGDLEQLRGVLGPWLERNGGVFYHGGHVEGFPAAAELAGVDASRVPVETKPMQPIHTYPNLFAGIDIGLVPLADVPFNHAKSDIKGLEYAAAGVAFASSPTPEYRTLGAALARRPRDWRAILDRLADPEERRRERDRLWPAVEARSIANRWHDWEEAYTRILAAAEAPVTIGP